MLSRVQRVVFGIGILGSLIMLVVFTVTSRASFVASWNALAKEYGSLDYASFPGAVGAPETWSWVGTLGISAYMILIVGYAYYTCFVGGEVKNPDKTLIKADWLATAVPVGIVIWFAVVAYKTLGFSFLSAASITDLSGGAEGYALPFLPNIMNLTYVMWDNPVVECSCRSASWPSASGGSCCRTSPCRESCSRGAWTGWGRSGSQVSAPGGRRRSRPVWSRSSASK
jgi:hypothetical protein